MCDKTPEIRKLTEEVVLETMRASSYEIFNKGIQDLKPAVKQTVKQILDSCKTKIGGSADESPFEPVEEAKVV